MKLRRQLFVAVSALAAPLLLDARLARACGGCFHSASESQSTVITGHRMAFAISTTQTVLWDQIKYAGSPTDFAWVLPVKAGAVLELSHDAWFETLDAATSTQINSPALPFCAPTGYGTGDYSGGSPNAGCGCGDADSARYAFDTTGGTATTGTTTGGGPPPVPPVTVVHDGTVGPYETVTLHANVPNALPSWLSTHGYAIPTDVSPVIDAYVKEGFDFIAMRLQPGEGVATMRPVRVVTSGASPALPLRMVAAGTGANVAITLFVIGEGRWEPQNFLNGQVDPTKLTWSWTSQSSNYTQARLALLAQGQGRTWNTAFAALGGLLQGNGSQSITVGTQPYAALADAFAAQGVLDNEATQADASACSNTFDSLGASASRVVACSPGTSGTGGSGADGGSGTGGGGTGSADAGTTDAGATDAGATDAGATDAGTGGAGGGGGGADAPAASVTQGPPCSTLMPDETPAYPFACGSLDDVAVALIGMHPSDVWLTRLEANLPRAALATDLQIQASAQQTQVSNIINVTNTTGDPCSVTTAAGAVGGAARGAALAKRFAWLAAALALVGVALGRRRRRALAWLQPTRMSRGTRPTLTPSS